MASFYKKILAISGVFGIVFALFMHHDLLQEIPGFHCESFGCIGNGLNYMIIAFGLIPLVISIVGYTVATETKLIKTVQSFGLAVVIMSLSVLVVFNWNMFSVQKAVNEAMTEEESLELIRQSEEVVDNENKNEALQREQLISEATEVTQMKTGVRKLGAGLITTGIVIDHNLENTDVGGYLQIKLDINDEDAFIIYNPYFQGAQTDCLNRIDTDVVVGDKVEVRGFSVIEYNSVEPLELIISTCESSNSYIKKI